MDRHQALPPTPQPRMALPVFLCLVLLFAFFSSRVPADSPSSPKESHAKNLSPVFSFLGVDRAHHLEDEREQVVTPK